MFRCSVCGADECHEEKVEEVFHLGDQYVLVDNMPAAVCNRCGDMTFSADTVERVRVLVHGQTRPAKSIPLSVFEFPHDGDRAAAAPLRQPHLAVGAKGRRREHAKVKKDTMKIHYHPETDSLYLELKAEPGVETREVADGFNVDVDANGEVVGFDIDHATKRFDLSTVEVEALPVRTYRAG